MSIRVKAFCIVLGAAIVIVGVAIGVGLLFVQNNIERAIEDDMVAVAGIADELVSSRIGLLEADASAAAEAIDRETPEALAESLKEQTNAYEYFLALTLVDREGVIASYGSTQVSVELLESEFVLRAFTGESLVSTTRYDSSGELVIDVVVPAGNDVLIATIPGMYFSELFADFTIFETGNIFILDAQGFNVANIRPEWVIERYNFLEMSKTDSRYERIASVVAGMIEGEPGVGRFALNGEERICVYTPIAGSKTGWTLGVVAPLSESSLGSVHNGVLLVGLVCLLLSLIAAIIASNILGKPYQEINRLVVSLDAARQEAVASAEAKSDFLANMSHEMRTPLNAIIGLSELALDDGDASENVRENLEKVYGSGVTLLSLINDILDISKIESGKFELVEAAYDTPSLINDTSTLNIVRIGSKPIEFELSIDESFPSLLIGDELRVKQIFNNLLSNAFKYTEKGSVVWSLSFERDGEDILLVSSIRDTGSGIRREDIAKLFSDYNQVDTKSNRRIEGTGLGLSICKSMVEAMDGTIEVESEYGEGSTFTVRIRQGRVNDVVIGAKVAENLRRFDYSDKKRDRRAKLVRVKIPDAKVLIVDDIQTNLDVARGMMKPYGMRIDCALSGYEAIEMVRDAEVHYDALFMDHMMPGLDGIEATRIIREEIGTDYAKTVPIIALTANAIVGNEEMFLEHGFQAFLSKPIDIMRLDDVINRWIRERKA